jgi:polyketide cyclase/dehydrase/lipid transport protein
MARRLAFVLALAVLAPALALAHGPTRQKANEQVEINAPPEKVWAAIGNFQDMSWHPAVAKTEGSGGNEQGATRTLTLQSGGKIQEKLNKYDKEGRSFSYEITEVDVMVLPVTNYSSTISVKGEGGKSTVEWRGAFYRGFMNNDPPPELSDEAATKAITGVYRGGLDALKKKLESGS